MAVLKKHAKYKKIISFCLTKTICSAFSSEFSLHFREFGKLESFHSEFEIKKDFVSKLWKKHLTFTWKQLTEKQH